MSLTDRDKFIDFDIISGIDSELADPKICEGDDKQIKEIKNDDILIHKILSGTAPTIDTVYRYASSYKFCDVDYT